MLQPGSASSLPTPSAFGTNLALQQTNGGKGKAKRNSIIICGKINYANSKMNDKKVMIARSFYLHALAPFGINLPFPLEMHSPLHNSHLDNPSHLAVGFLEWVGADFPHHDRTWVKCAR